MSTPDTPGPDGDAADTLFLLRRLVERNGTWVLVTVFTAVAVWLGLHLARAALVLVVRLLACVMARADRYASTRVLTPPPRRVNHYFDGHNGSDYDPHHYEHGHTPGPAPGRYWEAAHA
ncbi:hypothetical protein [Amycolatopsis sp. FDAARGOS 1241]|uniref:hypothetical protein n=1 Tax=Amycolatopsis sp. FDAARGOS 1241 TaxID=2778070 RepID=UPI001951558B|nr:hypothetical protein [Amycolatopsis sp. FDAARGOS 1241]QRP47419.1 hypothetical protein I6J71_05475 [Amycolatopsis sp. FDAARGOS 1241]